MRIGEAFASAGASLLANRLRSLLTMLGVIIGVASVVTLVAIGSGAEQEVTQQVEGLGSNLILVVPGQVSFGSAPTVSQLGLSDITFVARVVGDPRSVAATVTSSEQVRVGTRTAYVTVNGVNQNVPLVFTMPMAQGVFLTSGDVLTDRRVAVLGADIARRLFGYVDPIARQVTIAGVRFRVIGVFARRGSAFGVSRDSSVDVPLTAAQRLFGVNRVDALAVKAPTVDSVTVLQHRLVAALEVRYPNQKFSAVTQDQILGAIGTILGLLTIVLAAIAGISLLVGGVGVSNIMLVSVRERTSEVGLRKALGARQRDITSQFLVEAVLLTTLGGLIGIGVGVGVAAAANRFYHQLPMAIAWWSIVLAFFVSVAVGVFFGVFPARRAGRLDPVVALRSE